MRCIVVGSGITGMTAALLLARQGHAVTLLEAAPRPAPLLRGFGREGLHFDTGFHYGGGLHPGGLLHRWLNTLGVLHKLAPLQTAHDAHEDHFYFAETSRPFVLPTGTEKLAKRLDDQFPGQGLVMRQLLTQTEEVLAHSPYTNPECLNEPAFWHGAQHSVEQHLAGMNFPPQLALMLGMRCLLYGTQPSQAAWEDYALVAGPYFQSCGTWLGGGAALTEAFLQCLREANITIRCHATVSALVTEPGKSIHAVALQDGTVLPCEQCVFTGHPRQLEALLPKGRLRPAYYTHIRSLPETWPALMLFAETYSLAAGHSRYLLPPQQHCHDDGFFLPEDASHPLIYLSCGYPQPESSQPERIPLLVMAFMRPDILPAGNPQPRPSSYLSFKKNAVARLSSHVEKRCPELRGNWRILAAATGMTTRQWVHGSTGSLYGLCHDMQNMPLLPLTRVPGLFLAGQNILLPGVLGGIISAALAVGFAQGHDAVLKEFRSCTNDA